MNMKYTPNSYKPLKELDLDRSEILERRIVHEVARKTDVHSHRLGRQALIMQRIEAHQLAHVRSQVRRVELFLGSAPTFVNNGAEVGVPNCLRGHATPLSWRGTSDERS